MLSTDEADPISVLTLCFNQTQSLLYIGTNRGFRILRLDDGCVTSARDRDPSVFTPNEPCIGGFAYLSPLFNTQTVALVGSANNPRFKSTRVLLWDDHSCEIKNQFRFRSEVKGVMLRRDHIVIVCEVVVYVYLITSMTPISYIETCPNEYGVGAISYQNDRFFLATLDSTPGHVRLENVYSKEVLKGPMHDNPVSLLALDFAGRLGASASEQGTIIRVFKCDSWEVLHELRRGSRPAAISSLTFSPSLMYLVGASDHGTLHVWQVRKSDETSYLGGMITGWMPTYFQYSRSIAKLALPVTRKLTSRYTTVRGPVSCFTSETDLMVAHLDGLLYKCRLDPLARTLVVLETLPYLDVPGVKDWASM